VIHSGTAVEYEELKTEAETKPEAPPRPLLRDQAQVFDPVEYERPVTAPDHLSDTSSRDEFEIITDDPSANKAEKGKNAGEHERIVQTRIKAAVRQLHIPIKGESAADVFSCSSCVKD